MTTTATRRFRGGAVLLCTAGLVSGGLATALPAAAATNLGSLSFSPTAGTDISSIEASTRSTGTTPGCPTGTTNVRAVVNNAAAGWNNVTIVGNTTQGLSTSSDFSVPFTDTFRGTAQRNALTIQPGNYVVSLICQNRLGSIQFGQFDGTMTFTTSSTYTSQAPVQTTSTTLSASPASPSQQGTPVTFTAAVSPAASGTVQFKDGTTNLGSPVAASNGQAASAPQVLSTGSHSITAQFTPTDSSAFTGSTSGPLGYTVTAAPAQNTTTSVTASPGSPSQQGTPVTFTASVSPAAAGAVQFKDGTTNLGSPVAVSNGQAASAPQTLSTGSHSITGVFTPSNPAQFNGSTSAPLSYTVTAAPQPAQNTTTSVTASPGSPSQQGTPVTFSASVSPSAAGAVQFRDGTTNLGSPVAVSNGQAASAPQTLSTGSHSITGVFTPSNPAQFNGSTSAPLSYTVTAAQPVQQQPVVTQGAHITGGPVVSHVVSCEATFTGASSMSYTWFRDGRIIPNATGKDYRLTSSDRYKNVSCTVTARNASGSTSSHSPSVYVRNGIKCYWTPSVLSWGKGKFLAFPGIYGPAPSSISVQWYRDGRPIAGDTNFVHHLVAADRGHVLAFTVTVRAPREQDRVVHSNDRRVSR